MKTSKKQKSFLFSEGIEREKSVTCNDLERTNVACGQLPVQSKHGRHKSNNQNTAVRSFFDDFGMTFPHTDRF